MISTYEIEYRVDYRDRAPETRKAPIRALTAADALTQFEVQYPTRDGQSVRVLGIEVGWEPLATMRPGPG